MRPDRRQKVLMKVGQSLASTTDATVVIVVRAPQSDVEQTCGGAAMREGKQGAPVAGTEPAAGHDEGTELGKRYESPDGDVELMCIKPGKGSLALNGALLAVKTAKTLPSSD